MKILIGILYCGENEYEQCREAIRKQTYKNYDVFVIENRPNKEAHDLLYRRFMENADTYDVFIKIDADMVLSNHDVFSYISKMHKKYEKKKRIVFPVFDNFTEEHIYGVNTYKSTVVFRKNSDSVYTDRVDMAGEALYIDDKKMGSIADHCPAPSDRQALHFGLHKAMKVVAGSDLFHLGNIIKTYLVWKKRKTRFLFYAAIGGVYGLIFRVGPECANYGSEQFNLIAQKVVEEKRWNRGAFLHVGILYVYAYRKLLAMKKRGNKLVGIFR